MLGLLRAHAQGRKHFFLQLPLIDPDGKPPPISFPFSTMS